MFQATSRLAASSVRSPKQGNEMTDVPPYAFIQWKGTDLCMDFHCECGAHCHFDGMFAYTVQCPHCSTVWEMPQTVVPRKADAKTPEFWRCFPKMLDAD